MMDESEQGEEVLYEVSEGVATLTLNRPERMNTISRLMLARLAALLIRANEDEAVRVIVLTGKGRAFCAGLDMNDATSGDGIGSEASTREVSVTVPTTGGPAPPVCVSGALPLHIREIATPRPASAGWFGYG